jgi:hypothetical protein
LGVTVQLATHAGQVGALVAARSNRDERVPRVAVLPALAPRGSAETKRRTDADLARVDP